MTPGSESGQAEHVEIGLIRKPVGLHGWCAVTAHGNTLPALGVPCEVAVGSDTESLQQCTLVDMRTVAKGVQCRFEGYEDRESAETLRDRRIFIDKARLPSLQSEEYYHFELEAMSVVSSQTGVEVGSVKSVHNYPSVDAIGILLLDGREVLVPITEAAIKRIDRKAKKIIVDEEQLGELLI
jgi:16S rRNA processing protein RimM